jgi:hypothetical protein
MILAGHGAKPADSALSIHRSQEADIGSDGSSSLLDDQDIDDGRRNNRQSLDDEAPAPAAEGGEPAQDFQFETPDPEEAKRKAAEAMQGAGEAASKAADDAQKALMAILPVGDLFKALGWHLDFCCYLATMYAVYYVWKSDLHWRLLPRLEWAQDKNKPNPEDLRLKKKYCDIETGWVSDDMKGDGLGPNTYDLLWFRLAKGEKMHFAESKRVLPGFVDTLMCGCGGNVFAFAVTSKRLIIQNDKRCLFGSTVLTTNEESYFLKDIHKASLHTDGSLNLGCCVLHSAEMLRGGFNWIFAGFVIDILLEWKPAFLANIQDERLLGWINMVPNDVIYLIASLFVLLGGFLFVALLWFLLVPQSTLEIEIVKQAGTATYYKKFECPVLEAYHAYDAIMSGRLDNRHRE